MTITYTPEMNQKKTPFAAMESRMSFYGTHYYVDTALEIKGRGITKISTNSGKHTYKVTVNAYKKLESEYTIAMCSYLD